MENKKIKTIIVTALGFFVGYYLVNQIFFKKPSFDEVMMETASSLNKTCPIMVDAETRLDNTIALPENVFLYNYTLVKLTREEIDTNLFKSALRPKILNTVKTNPDFKPLRDNNVIMEYSYKDKNSNFIYKFVFAPKDYK